MIQKFSSDTMKKTIKNIKNPRYHLLEFSENKDVPIIDSVIYFKHYFSINIQYLLNNVDDKFVCSVSDLFREDISQRFSSFLSRIGLPKD